MNPRRSPAVCYRMARPSTALDSPRHLGLLAASAVVPGALVGVPLARMGGFGTNILPLFLAAGAVGFGALFVAVGLVCLCFRRSRTQGKRFVAIGLGFAAGVVAGMAI